MRGAFTMDFYIDIGVAVLLRVLREDGPSNKYRRVFLKVFKSIAHAYQADEEFLLAASSEFSSRDSDTKDQ
jgi:phage anti-repressor protein